MSLYSSYWYKVAGIRPRLHPHVHLYRHVYRGRDWYILQNSLSGRQHRFNRTAYAVIGLMDGQRSVQQIWDIVTSTLGDDAPTQDEVIQMLGQLHSSDVLQSNIPADTLEMFNRREKQHRRWKQRLTNPFALRFPLIDPDHFLVRWIPLLRPAFSWAGALLWLLVVGSAFVLAALHWPELTRDITDRVLTPKNLFLLWLVYPVVKLLHEMGHAFATRIWGGEVHEMGIMLLAFTPIPYVEASASAAFPDKRKRMAVAAIGMAVELFLASMALFLWLNVEPGKLSTLLYNVMLIGGVSTVLFNGNPLLRFDGYYILSDWLEIPNLAQRSTRYLGYLLQRYLFGIKEASSPVTAPGERPWFVFYGIASSIYQVFILAVLVLFVSSRFFIFGILIAFWALGARIVAPVLRTSVRFYSSIGARRRRIRVLTVSLVVAIIGIILLVAIPVPMRTRSQGIVSLPEYSRIRAGTDCVIKKVLAEDGTRVEKNQAVLQCEDPFLESEVRVLEANLARAKAKYTAQSLQSRVRREILKREIALVQDDLARAMERKAELVIRSHDKGFLVLPDGDNLPGHFVRQGALLGYVLGETRPMATLIVSQADISLVRRHTEKIELRLADHLERVLTAVVDREIPAASDILPSPALGVAGGGDIPVDPRDPQHLRTLAKTFQVEVRLPADVQDIRIGQRVYALFDHGYKPIALQWYRRLRQLFLHRFHV